MPGDSIITIVWRRKWIVIAATLVFVAAAAAISQTVAKVYETSAELLIVQSGATQSFDAVQAAQVSARTYGTIITSPTVAQLVADDLRGAYTRDQLLAKVTAEPVPETQLLRITVSDQSPRQAKALADTYTRVFLEYVRTRLFPSTRVAISVAAVAPVPDAPSRPQPRLYVLVALLIGLGFGLAFAILRERLDTRVRSAEELESELGLPILARLPRGGRGDLDRETLVEALRLTYATLQVTSGSGVLRSIAVTSYAPREGKSTTVAHLALAVASSGRDVTVVEADVRRPTLQPFFLPDERGRLQAGLTSLAVGDADVADVTLPTYEQRIDIVPAGPPVPSLSSLLQSDRGRELIARLSASSELTLFDLPPLTAGADAATVAAATDGVILVVDIERATRAAIQESLRQLNGVRANVIGLVVNRDPAVGKRAYGYE